MKAHARLVAECRDGRTVLRELRSVSPLTLIPKRGSDIVHLVNSASAPLGGDELRLSVRVGAGARLKLLGVAATLALPGLGAESMSIVDIEIEPGGSLTYLPEPTVITSRARHTAELRVSLASDARLHTREVLVLGRSGERPGWLRTTQRVVRDGVPVLHQTLNIGDPAMDASLAHLAGRKVLATELICDNAPVEPASGEWWSRSPLTGGGYLAAALAHDAVTAQHGLAQAAA